MPRPRSWTDDELVGAVASATSWFDVCRSLGLTAGGGTYAVLRRHASRLGAATDHLPGLVEGRPVTRRRFTDDDLRRAVDTCSCGRAVWRCRPIPLELDHVNGDPTDNRLENLRVLCPNCHALTPTYCGRNRGRVVELADTAALGAVASA